METINKENMAFLNEHIKHKQKYWTKAYLPVYPDESIPIRPKTISAKKSIFRSTRKSISAKQKIRIDQKH